MIQLRFCRNKGIVSRLIRLITWSEYSHVEFVTIDGYLGALVNGGVQVRSFFYAPHNEFVYRHIDCTPEQEKVALSYARSQVGKPYDITAILGIMMHRDWRSPKAWFCSELCFAACEAGGIQLLREIPENRVTPQDIFISPLVTS